MPFIHSFRKSRVEVLCVQFSRSFGTQHQTNTSLHDNKAQQNSKLDTKIKVCQHAQTNTKRKKVCQVNSSLPVFLKKIKINWN